MMAEAGVSVCATSWRKLVDTEEGFCLWARVERLVITVQLDLSAFDCTFMYLAEIPIPILLSHRDVFDFQVS